MKTIQVIIEATKPVIATRAQKVSNDASNVVVIDGEVVTFARSRIDRHIGFATNGTFALLGCHHRFELRHGKAIATSASPIFVSWLSKVLFGDLDFALFANRMAFIFAAFIASPTELGKRQESSTFRTGLAYQNWGIKKISRAISRIALHRGSSKVLVSGHGC